MTCDNCQDREQCPIRNAQIRAALMSHENNPYLDELTKVTPDQLRHTNMYKEKPE